MPQIAGKEVGQIGFGLMGLTRPGNGLSDDDAIAVLHYALHQGGANFWNGGEFYGPEEANSLVLLEKYFTRYPEDADEIVLSIKGGCDKPCTFKMDSSRGNVRRSVLDCAAQLKGRKQMDMFELGRQDGVTPWEDSIKYLQELIAEGQFDHISLSEVRAETIHRVVKVAKVAFVEVELSLMTREVLTNGVAAACAEHNIPLIAYSPLGRGLLTGTVKSTSDLPHTTQRFPRYSAENLPTNLKLVEQIEKLAAQKKCTPAQLAINWVRCLSKRPGMPVIVPIPGGTSIAKLEENMKVVDVTVEELDSFDAILGKYEIKGGRYPAGLPTNT